jgi:hypothetical protein
MKTLRTERSTLNTSVLENENRWLTLLALFGGCVLIFVLRNLLAQTILLPSTFDIFDTLIVAGALVAALAGYRRLTRRDVLVSAGAGVFIGAQMPFATLFSPYPFFQVVQDPFQHGLIRGLYTAIALLGGLAILRSGGPVKVSLVNGEGRTESAGTRTLRSLAFGAVVGIPLAVLNMFANRWMQGRPFDWQSPFSAAVDALQPAIYEDVLYRLTFLGLAWWVLHRAWPERKAAILTGALVTLVHAYAHLDDLFMSQPLAALGIGAVMALVWGAPLAILALRRDLECAIAFHWTQDALRFFAGL